MALLSCLKAFLYFSNNSSLFAILMHGLSIPIGLFCEDVYHIHCSYSTFAKQYGSLTSVTYKKTFFNFSRSNENTLLTITANIKMSHCFNFNIYLELWQIQFLKMWQTLNDYFLVRWSTTVVFAPLHIYLHEEVNELTADK